MRLVRDALPGHELLLAGPLHLGAYALRAGLVDGLLPASGLDPLPALPGTDAPLELAIDLHGNGPASRELLQAYRPRRLIAYTTDAAAARRRRWSVWDPAEHEVRRWVRLVSEALDADPKRAGGVAGSLPVPDLDPRLPAGATVLHPGASARSRQWPPERFAAVGEHLRRRGHVVVVTGSGAERALAEEVAAACGSSPLVDLNLDDLFALVAAGRLVVCGDTGVAHVASAFRTPSVVLFGPVAPAQWGPPQAPIHRALYAGEPTRGTGDPHGAVVDPVLLRLDAGMVLAAADDVLHASSYAAGPS